MLIKYGLLYLNGNGFLEIVKNRTKLFTPLLLYIGGIIITENNLYDTDQEKEKVILVGIEDESKNGLISIEDSLDELGELAETAGAEVMGRISQKRNGIHPSSYIGKGKIEELKDLIDLWGATCVICDDELTGSQMRNLSDALDLKVIDRTILILDIFAGRANSAEGKLQVELATLKYNLSHLIGLGKSMSKLGGGVSGGIGARRGAGETKLELDRRVIRDQISGLNREIKLIQKQRAVSRDKMQSTNIPVISMVGYTNAGKSTLMNLITKAGVFAEDKLFATLDTTTRKVKLPGGTEILFTDTVGFIQKLPHNLIEAFKATLEELNYSDILVHVVDGSNKMREEQMQVVYDTLSQLGCLNKPLITVYNKIDKEVEYPLPNDKYAEKKVNLSALTGKGSEEFLDVMEELIQSFRNQIQVTIPYSETKLIAMVHGRCEIIKEDYQEDGIYFELYSDAEMKKRLECFSGVKSISQERL